MRSSAAALRALRSSDGHSFVEDVERPKLSAEETRHLVRVKRLRPKHSISVGDGQGRWRLCALKNEANAGKGGESWGELEVKSEVFYCERERVAVTVGLSLIPAAGFDLALEKLTVSGSG